MLGRDGSSSDVSCRGNLLPFDTEGRAPKLGLEPCSEVFCSYKIRGRFVTLHDGVRLLTVDADPSAAS